MRGDLRTIGFAATRKVRVAASATRYEVGEPLHSLAALTSGIADVNTFVLAAADTPVIGTHIFGGVAISNCVPFASGTVAAHAAQVSRPVAYAGILEGRAETVTSADTQTEITGLLNDTSLIDYNSTGASDGGELYTIKEVGSADTSGLTIVGGNPATSVLYVEVCAQAYRHDVS